MRLARPAAQGPESGVPVRRRGGGSWWPRPPPPSLRRPAPGYAAAAARPAARATPPHPSPRAAWAARSAGRPAARPAPSAPRSPPSRSAARSAPRRRRAPRTAPADSALPPARVDHRQVGRHRHAVVEEARVLHAAVGVVDVFLVQRPADALRRRRPGSAPRHTMDGWPGRRPAPRCSAGWCMRPVSGSTSTSQMCTPKPGPAPCTLAVTSAPIAPPVPARASPRSRPAAADSKSPALVPAGTAAAVLPVHRIGRDVPDLRRAPLQFLDHVAGGLHHAGADREGDAAAAGQHRMRNGSGVGDGDAHLLVRQPEHLGRHHGERGARPADIGVGRDHRYGAVLVDVHRRRAFAADVEPEARGDAAPLVRPQRARASAGAPSPPPAPRRSRCRGRSRRRPCSCPSRATFFSRSAIGSMPSLRASSSIVLSTPNAPIGAPGAR